MSNEWAQGGKVTAADINLLRSSIRDEIARYDSHGDYGPYTLYEGTAFSPGATTATSGQYNNLRTMVAYLTTVPASLAAGTKVQITHWTELKARYDVIRQDCICNSDCSCNNVCSCHNDCGCNYSDQRLKENIKFIETRNGLNIYSWTYIWDKATEYVGVIAQELVGTKHEQALKKDARGFYMVNYKLLPI
jgi:hypothetical protein